MLKQEPTSRGVGILGLQAGEEVNLAPSCLNGMPRNLSHADCWPLLAYPVSWCSSWLERYSVILTSKKKSPLAGRWGYSAEYARSNALIAGSSE